ncbi:MAG: family 16 glycosylhydrolase, partial [Bacteroidota bacterium]
MKKLLFTLLAMLILSGIMAQSQPTFNPGQDPKPAGKKWQKIENMSDEFSGSSLNTTKWDDQDPQWKGRAPALFSVNAISVGGGDLKIVADDNLTQQELNQNPGFTHQGGLVRSINKATYGYYETRMKANRTCLSSTFWLFNKRNEFTGCDERTTELDVTENIGVDAYPEQNRNWVDQNIRSINSNTHSRDVVGNPGCGIPTGQNGNKSPIGEEAWQDYHVYGVWWKNKSELYFFLDGQQVFQITPPADFDLGMYLRRVVESYDWNKPRAGFDNMNLPLDQRTTYYDWTRSWELVDDNSGGGSSSVDCNSLPSSLTSSTSITVPVAYTSDQQRDVVVELWNSGWLSEGRLTVGSGSGTANITINLNAAPAPGSNYQLKASIRPVGSNWQQNIDACTKSGVSITNAGGPPDVDCNSLPSALQSSNSISVSVDYTSDQQRDVVVELWNSGWLGEGKTTVGAGSGTAT